MSTLISTPTAPTTPPLLELSPSQKSLVKAWWRKVNSNLASEKANRHEKQGVVFGIPLTDSLKYAHSRISYIDERTGNHCNAIIPIIVAKCGAFLKEKALYTEGIFRLSGNAKRISMLQAVFDTRIDDYGLHLNWDDYTVHDASNVMRRFLNYLPEPLISLHYQALFKTTLDAEFPSLESKIDAFQNLIERLPIAHQYLLLYLLDLLYLFSQCVEYTRMDSSSLATAFSPVIFPDPSHATNPAGYKESQRVLEFLILHQDKFFMPNTSQNDIDNILAYPENYDKSIAPPLSPLPSFNRQRRHSATTNSSFERSKSPYSLPYISASVSDLFSFNKSNLTNTTIGSTSSATLPSSTLSSPFPTTLKRSKTAPSSKRANKFGDIDSSSSSIASKFTLGDANNSYTSLNQNNRNLGRWKSIKRVVKEEDEQLPPLSPPLPPTTPLSI
ncbi:GTPase activating protein (GAP) for Rho1p [Mucor circinelloides]